MSQPAPAAELHVLAPGQHTLVVDGGRPRCRSLGVSVSGAADRCSLALGNALVGNEPDAAALEVAFAGPMLRATAPLACVVYGAPFDISTDGRRLTAGTTFTLQPGETLHFGGTRQGARAYLCVAGGLQTPVVLGSRSGLAPLRQGDRLPCRAGSIHSRSAAIPQSELPFIQPWLLVQVPLWVNLRVIPGPQAAWFTRGALASTAEHGTFDVSPDGNRMGVRLIGPPLQVPSREMVSEPVCPGSVQVTRDGQCIILGVDGQTIGGYPKVAQVITADLDRVGQLRPGDRVRFEYTNLVGAELLYRQRQELLRVWAARLRTAEVFTS